VIREVEIASLRSVPIAESKPHLNRERVAWYVDHLDEAEPVAVFELDDGLLLADGYHRVEAARQLGRTAIKADVRKGSAGDAIRFAVQHAQEQRGLSADDALAAIRRRSGEHWGAPPTSD
jgi:uncharacterized protein (DUF1015 family)